MSTHGEPNDLRERPIGEVASQLTKDISLLVRQEVALAKEEMREKGRIALPGIGMIGAAGRARAEQAARCPDPCAR